MPPRTARVWSREPSLRNFPGLINVIPILLSGQGQGPQCDRFRGVWRSAARLIAALVGGRPTPDLEGFRRRGAVRPKCDEKLLVEERSHPFTDSRTRHLHFFRPDETSIFKNLRRGRSGKCRHAGAGALPVCFKRVGCAAKRWSGNCLIRRRIREDDRNGGGWRRMAAEKRKFATHFRKFLNSVSQSENHGGFPPFRNGGAVSIVFGYGIARRPVACGVGIF